MKTGAHVSGISALTFSLAILAGMLVLFMVLAGSRRMRAEILRLAEQLESGPTIGNLENAVPTIVADFALRNGAQPGAGLRAVQMNFEGEIRPRLDGRFREVQAWQVSALARPGFVWEARLPGPFPPGLRVLDALVAGEGRAEVRAAGFIVLARESGSALNLSQACRYLAELPWMPDAIPGNPMIAWRISGPGRVEARLTTPDGTACAIFDLDAHGDIASVLVPDRPARQPDGSYAPRAMIGQFSDYGWIGGRRLPLRAEVGWRDADGVAVWYRCRLTDHQLIADARAEPTAALSSVGALG